MTNRILNPIAILGMVNHSQFTVGIPICPRNIFQYLPRRASGKGRASKHASFRFEVCSVSPTERYSQLARTRDGQQVCVSYVHRLSKEGIPDGGEKLQWVAVPGRTVDNRPKVRREARQVNRARCIGQTLVRGRL